MTAGVINVLLVGNDMALLPSSSGLPVGPIGVDIVRTPFVADAPAFLHRRRFDAVLFNLNVRDDDYIAAIKWLHKRVEALPIAVISDGAGPDFTCQAIAHGAQDVMPSFRTCPSDLGRAILTSIERKRLEQHKIRHAREDELTGLANRALLEERFKRAVARADRHATLVALVALNLDQPEQLIDVYGADTIDHLMPLVSQRLMNEIRETDTLARTRDAGFTWLVEGLAAVNDIDVLVDRLPRLLAHPFSLRRRDISITVSVGVAVCPFHGRNYSTLHKMAEAAMLDVATLSGDGLLTAPLPPAL